MANSILESGVGHGVEGLNRGEEGVGNEVKSLGSVNGEKVSRGHKYIKSCLSGGINESSITGNRKKSLSISSKILSVKKLELIPSKGELDNCLCWNRIKGSDLDKLQFNETKGKELKFIQKSEKSCKKKKNLCEPGSRSGSKIRTSPILDVNKLKRFNSFSPKNLEFSKTLDDKEKVSEKSENQLEHPIALRIPLLNLRKNSEAKVENIEKSKKSGLKNPGIQVKSAQLKKKQSREVQLLSTDKNSRKKNDQKKLKTSKKPRNRSKSAKKSKDFTQTLESTLKKVRFNEESNNYIPIISYTVESENSDSEYSMVDHWVDIMQVNDNKCRPSEFVQEFELNLKQANGEIFKKLSENDFEEADSRFIEKLFDSEDKHISHESTQTSLKSSNFHR